MKFYHATTCENTQKIVNDGCIKAIRGEVYLCEKPIDACKFLAIRGMRKMTVFEVNLKKSAVRESFDHSEAFFKCKAYVYDRDIQLNGNETITEYEFDF